jgi:hypothetical protein
MATPHPPPDAAQTATLDAQIERLMRCSPLPEPEVKVREKEGGELLCSLRQTMHAAGPGCVERVCVRTRG